MTCRDEILAAMERLEQRSRRRELSLVEIVQEVLGGGSDYKEHDPGAHHVKYVS